MPTELEIAKFQWISAFRCIKLSEAEIARMMYWCREPKREQDPDLVNMIAWFTEADEKSSILEDDSIQVDEGLLSIADIKVMTAKQSGYMIASENHQPKLYQQLLNKQLKERVQSLIELLSQETIDSLDDDEIEDMLSERDTLEYARMGINVIRLQGRLTKVEYDSFTQGLKQIDQQLRQFLKGNTGIQKPPYTASTFWWRK